MYYNGCSFLSFGGFSLHFLKGRLAWLRVFFFVFKNLSLILTAIIYSHVAVPVIVILRNE